MQHICPEPGKIDFDAYLKYLDTISDLLPPSVREFAFNPNHYDLSSDQSLHDSWLQELRVEEIPSGESDRATRIGIRLLGQKHDRLIKLNYKGVSAYTVSGISNRGLQTHGHGDLFTHEVRAGDGGVIIHELLFADGSSITICCSSFDHSQELLANDT